MFEVVCIICHLAYYFPSHNEMTVGRFLTKNRTKKPHTQKKTPQQQSTNNNEFSKSGCTYILKHRKFKEKNS